MSACTRMKAAPGFVAGERLGDDLVDLQWLVHD